MLPEQGDYSLLALGRGNRWPVNGVQSIPELVKAISRLGTNPLDIYYAVGSYAGPRLAANATAKRCLYLDLDAKDFGSKGACATELKAFCSATGLPLPAIIVDSGGGLHVYWPFDRDLEINAWHALAKALKDRCKTAGFAADPTSTTDAARILRPPGTLNYKYDPPAAVAIVQDTGEVFDPSDLLRSLVGGLSDPRDPEVLGAIGPRAATAPGHFSVDINDALTNDIALEKPDPAAVRAMLRCIAIPASGSDRRGVWFDIIKGLHHWSEGSDEGFQIADAWSSTQPAYKSSEDVRYTWDSLQARRGLDRDETTVATVIKYARDAGYSPLADTEDEIEIPVTSGLLAAAQVPVDRPVTRIDELNARGGRKRLTKAEAISRLSSEFIYVVNQGTYYSIPRRNVLDKAVITDMYSWMMPASGDGRAQDPCTIMKNSFHTDQVDSMGFHPGESFRYTEHNKTFVNRYTAPAQEITPTNAEVRLFKDFVDYIFPRKADQAFKQYWLQWLAHLVQRPGVKIATSMLFISEKYGIGKTTAALEIPKLLAGSDNTRSINNDILERPFTAYLGEAHLLHLSEVHVNGQWNSSNIANRLKTIVTDSTVNVHRKGFDDYDIPNRVAVTATSNYNDAMYISSRQERRWGVYELVPARGYNPGQHRKYFDLIHQFLGSPRAAGVLRYIFARLSLKGFNPQEPPPMTLAKQRMEQLSLPDDAQILHDAWLERTAPFHKDLVQASELRHFLEAETGKKISSKRTVLLLQKALPDAEQLNRITARSGVQLRLWCVREVDNWRNQEPDVLLKELARED